MERGKEEIIIIIMIIAMERGKEAPDVLEGQPPWANRSAGNQSRWRERPSATKDGQEMARDGKRWCGKARKHDDNPRHSSRYLARPTQFAASQLLQSSKLLQTVGVLQSVE